MTNNTKDYLQYGTAITGLCSGIVLCFLSFFFNHYEITNSVLGYLGQWLIFASGVFGFSLYIKSKFLETESRINEKVNRRLNSGSGNGSDS